MTKEYAYNYLWMLHFLVIVGVVYVLQEYFMYFRDSRTQHFGLSVDAILELSLFLGRDLGRSDGGSNSV